MTRQPMRITKSIHFDAAHYLKIADAEEAGRPYARMHGHSFTLDVTLAGAPDPETGWIEDFAAVQEALEGLRNQLDHHLLNEIEGLEAPTLENICIWVADRLRADFPSLVEVRIARPSNGEACVLSV